MPAPFISQQDLADYTGRDVTNDAGALICVDAACDIIRDFAEQTFNQVLGDTIYLNGSGTDALLLPQGPVTAAGTVQVRTDGTAWTTAGAADYSLSTKGILYATD